MIRFIKGLLNKKEVARIQELEQENEKLKNELEELNEQAIDMHMKLKAIEDQEELEATSEKCSCGGYMIPMYEEHADWIKLCKSCGETSENADASPIVEPA